MKMFTTADVTQNPGMYPCICAETSELVVDPPAWMKAGLTQTASGYGAKLNSGLKINFNGCLYRIYHTCYSNVGSAWFMAKGVKYIVR